jgi:hypothetical protein
MFCHLDGQSQLDDYESKWTGTPFLWSTFHAADGTLTNSRAPTAAKLRVLQFAMQTTKCWQCRLLCGIPRIRFLHIVKYLTYLYDHVSRDRFAHRFWDWTAPLHDKNVSLVTFVNKPPSLRSRNINRKLFQVALASRSRRPQSCLLSSRNISR